MSRARRASALVALLTAVAAWLPSEVAAQTFEGTWRTRIYDRADRDDVVHLQLEIDRGRRGNWNTGFGIEATDLTGITLDQLRGSAEDVSFRLVREAGTVQLQGSIRDGRGTGWFTFTPDRAFADRMAFLGFPGLEDEQLFSFAVHDITTQYVEEMRALGYDDLDEDELMSFAIHGVSPEMVRELDVLGYSNVRPQKLVQLRIHGVTPDYVRRVRAALGRS